MTTSQISSESTAWVLAPLCRSSSSFCSRCRSAHECAVRLCEGLEVNPVDLYREWLSEIRGATVSDLRVTSTGGLQLLFGVRKPYQLSTEESTWLVRGPDFLVTSAEEADPARTPFPLLLALPGSRVSAAHPDEIGNALRVRFGRYELQALATGTEPAAAILWRLTGGGYQRIVYRDGLYVVGDEDERLQEPPELAQRELRELLEGALRDLAWLLLQRREELDASAKAVLAESLAVFNDPYTHEPQLLTEAYERVDTLLHQLSAR